MVTGAAKHSNFIILKPIINPQTKDTQEPMYQYINELNIETLQKERAEEMVKRTVIKLKSLGYKPSYKEYKMRFENIPKFFWKKSIKTFKRSKS